MKKLILTFSFLLSPFYFASAQIPATTPTKFQPLDPDLTAIAALSGTNTIYYRSAANTWSAVTIGGNLTFSGGTLNAPLTDLSATQLTSGTVPVTRLSLTLAELNTAISNDDVAGLAASNTFTGANINSKSGAASVSAMKYIGAPFAGTGTTSFPLLYINDSAATASTTLSTSGTYFGVNGHGSADLMNLLLDGTSKLKVTSAGAVTSGSDMNSGGHLTANGGSVRCGNGRFAVGGAEGGLNLASDIPVRWYSGTFGSGSLDTGVTRNAAGVVEINNGTAGTYRDLLIRNATLSGTLSSKGTSTAPTTISASDIDWSTSNVFSKTLAANTTFTFSSTTSGQTIIVALTNTASNYTVTWPTVSWSGGIAPTQTTGVKTDVYTFIKIGSVFYGSVQQNF